jgi:formylglycine-generating enzyme required for sulfatase activity
MATSTWTNSIGMEFVLIPAGTFMMGSPDSDAKAPNNEKPAHRITISQPFYLGKYPITQAQWEAIMGNNLSQFKGSLNRPVEAVFWNDAQAFLRELNKREGGGDYRLPTEAQWEYACRAGTQLDRYGSDLDAIAWYKVNSGRATHEVGQKLPNDWGLYDMLGNVSEWVQDRYAGSYYQHSPIITDPQGPDYSLFSIRVLRGGSWRDNAWNVRAAYRDWLPPGLLQDNSVGFRCLSSVPSK